MLVTVTLWRLGEPQHQLYAIVNSHLDDPRWNLRSNHINTNRTMEDYSNHLANTNCNLSSRIRTNLIITVVSDFELTKRIACTVQIVLLIIVCSSI